MKPLAFHTLVITSLALSPWLCWPGSPDGRPDGQSNSTETMEVPPALAPVGGLALHERVRNIIRPDCGSCHTSTLPTAKPGAVKVFDLAREDWHARMSKDQLESFGRRLRKLEEPARSTVKAFVEREIGKREGQD